MKTSDSPLHYRPLLPADIGHVPLQHQGTPAEVRARVAAYGSSAMLVFDGTMCVGQLQFRPYVPDTVSPNGLHDPLYWMDFNGSAPALPAHTLALFCYHVGQLDDTDARDPRYFGRGIGIRLLEETIAWATKAGFTAIVAKGLTALRPVIEYMGGLPASVYGAHRFVEAVRYHDAALRAALEEMLAGHYGAARQDALRTLVQTGASLDEAARITICVRWLP
jgi:GNAT superfamily N-acetyltransferase